MGLTPLDWRNKYLQDNYGVTIPRNTTKTVSFVHLVVGENYAVRGTKLGKDYTAENVDKALWENKERSALNDRLFISEEQQSTKKPKTTTTTTYAEPNIETFISQLTSKIGSGKSLAPRSISYAGSELRSLDEIVQSITGKNQSDVGMWIDWLKKNRRTTKHI